MGGWTCSTFGLSWLLDNSVSSGSSATAAVEIDSRGIIEHRALAPEPNQVNVHARAHFVILLSAGGSVVVLWLMCMWWQGVSNFIDVHANGGEEQTYTEIRPRDHKYIQSVPCHRYVSFNSPVTLVGILPHKLLMDKADNDKDKEAEGGCRGMCFLTRGMLYVLPQCVYLVWTRDIWTKRLMEEER